MINPCPWAAVLEGVRVANGADDAASVRVVRNGGRVRRKTRGRRGLRQTPGRLRPGGESDLANAIVHLQVSHYDHLI